jgi:hypothetical protein
MSPALQGPRTTRHQGQGVDLIGRGNEHASLKVTKELVMGHVRFIWRADFSKLRIVDSADELATATENGIVLPARVSAAG